MNVGGAGVLVRHTAKLVFQWWRICNLPLRTLQVGNPCVISVIYLLYNVPLRTLQEIRPALPCFTDLKFEYIATNWIPGLRLISFYSFYAVIRSHV